MKRTWFTVLLALSLAAPALAQEPRNADGLTASEALALYRQDYPTPMDTAAHVGELLNRVAWDFRASGAKLLGKTGGSTCPMPNGVSISCDYLVHAPSFSGHDVFGDAGAGGQTKPESFAFGPGPEDFIPALKDGSRTFVDPVEPRPELLLKKPAAATAVSPANQAGDVANDVDTVKWDGKADSFDVYFGKTNPPGLAAQDLVAKEWKAGKLDTGTIYFWRVDSRNAKGVTEGPVWSFATHIPEVKPEPKPEEPKPEDPKPPTPPTKQGILARIISFIFGALFCLGNAGFCQ